MQKIRNLKRYYQLVYLNNHFIVQYLFLARDAMLARYKLSSCVRPSVCLDCLSHVDIVSKRLNVKSRTQLHTIAQELYFSGAKNLGEIPTGHPKREHQIQVW